jgi:hypothetical protein
MSHHRESRRSRRRGPVPRTPGARSSHTARSLSWSTSAVLVAVVVVTLGAYLGSLGHAFVDWDDPDAIKALAFRQKPGPGNPGGLEQLPSGHHVVLAANASQPLSPSRSSRPTSCPRRERGTGIPARLAPVRTSRGGGFRGSPFRHPPHARRVGRVDLGTQGRPLHLLLPPGRDRVRAPLHVTTVAMARPHVRALTPRASRKRWRCPSRS